MTSCCYPSRYSVLRLAGDDEQMIHLLHRSLTEYFASSSSESPPSYCSSEMLHITNQYFEARVLLERLTIVPSPNTASSLSVEADKEDKINDAEEDGIVLIFFLNSQANKEEISKAFNALSRHHQIAESSQQCGDLLRLCIGISNHDLMDTTSVSTKICDKEEDEEDIRNKEEEYTRRVLWCLDHGYEYVEADLTEYGRSIGHEDREKEGFARIVEAVGNTVWSTAKMHPRKARHLKSSYDVDKNNVTSKSTNTGDARSIKIIDTAEGDDSIIPAVVAVEATEVEAGTENDTTKHHSTEVTTSQSDLISNTTTGVRPSTKDVKVESLLKQEESEEDESKLESLEFLIKEANRIRDCARQGHISDDERRRQAGEMAIRLISAFGDEDFFGDSDSEDEETSPV